MTDLVVGIATGIYVIGVGALLKSNGSKVKKDNCEKYRKDFTEKVEKIQKDVAWIRGYLEKKK